LVKRDDLSVSLTKLIEKYGIYNNDTDERQVDEINQIVANAGPDSGASSADARKQDHDTGEPGQLKGNQKTLSEEECTKQDPPSDTQTPMSHKEDIQISPKDDPFGIVTSTPVLCCDGVEKYLKQSATVFVAHSIWLIQWVQRLHIWNVGSLQ
jgi:hypothetical protein